MKCPNCGAEMKYGLLYCESCGEDIHIVPDFEPEIEQNIEQNIKNVLDEVSLDEAPPEITNKLNIKWKWYYTLGIGVLVLLVLIGSIVVFHYYSADYQGNHARELAEAGQYEKSIVYYKRAIGLDPQNVDYKLGIAQVYFLENDKDNYEFWLRQIVIDPHADFEQLESAYGKLIAIYRAKEDYQTINDILLNCKDDAIRSSYQSYLAESPVFSVPEGKYDEVQVLKFMVTGKGTVYYTFDGSDPDETKNAYTTPILLENGAYHIRAIFINENGVSSDISDAKYEIHVSALELPEINIDSGEYDIPLNIVVTNSMQDVYYTTDGSTPTLSSTLYTEPIPMPLGVSNFRFARIRTGRKSEVVERMFTFELSTDLTAAQAVDIVRESNLESGKIYDNAGHFDDTVACYQYQYLYVHSLFDENIVYMIAEVLVDTEGVSVKTGNYFAVNVYTGELYKLYMDNGVFVLNGE